MEAPQLPAAVFWDTNEPAATLPSWQGISVPQGSAGGAAIARL